MELLQQYGKEIVALLVPFIAFLLNNNLKGRAKLVYAQPHQWIFKVDQPLLKDDGSVAAPTQTAHTRSILVVNRGREPAKNVEVVLNYKPLSVNVWPSRDYGEKTAPDRRYIVTFPSLAPGESLGLEVLTINMDLPQLIGVRSESSVAKEIGMLPQPVVGRPLQALVALLMFSGAAALTYWVIVLLQFLILKTA